jgi:hypothetical protein
MARSPHDSDRDFPASAPDIDDPAGIIARSELLEPFDDAARARFGRIISLMVTTKRKRSRS